MGILFSGLRSKVEYYKDQAAKARRDARRALKAGNADEASRLQEIADKADNAAISNRQMLEKANTR
jgi:hypothetical protein